MSAVELQHLRDGATTLEGLAGAVRRRVSITFGETAVANVVPLGIGGVFPRVAPHAAGRPAVRWLAGRPRRRCPVAVLDYRFWREQTGGDETVIGRTIEINGHPFTIVGVTPERFHGPGPERPPVWLPLSAWPLLAANPAILTDRATREVGLIGAAPRRPCGHRGDRRVEPAAAARGRRRRAGGATRPPRIHLDAGREYWTGELSPEKRIEFLLVTIVPLVIVAALLWIACSNVANLLLARGVTRRREIAIRLATGASRGRIVALLLGEALLLALAGGALGVLVGGWTLDAVFAAFSQFGNIDVQLDGAVLAYTALCRASRRAGRPRAGARGVARGRLVGPQGRGHEPHRQRSGQPGCAPPS